MTEHYDLDYMLAYLMKLGPVMLTRIIAFSDESYFAVLYPGALKQEVSKGATPTETVRYLFDEMQRRNEGNKNDR